MKYAVVTTFSNASWNVYAKEMLASFRRHWVCPIFVVLDDKTLEVDVAQLLRDASPKGAHPEDTLATQFTEEQAAFIKRNFDKDDQKDYRKMVTKFSYKVFAVHKAMKFFGDNIDYLIWMDSDIITNKDVTQKDIEGWVKEHKMVSYLGRKDWSATETGFLIFNMRHFANTLIEDWKNLYTTDKIIELEEWTDADAFDYVRLISEDLVADSHNLCPDAVGMNVFEQSPLASHMTHYKGQLKTEIPKQYTPKEQHSNAMHGKTFSVDNLGILTQNCITHDIIQENVRQNMKIIPTWLDECSVNDEEIVICSAGPSLSADDILPWYRKGVKIVAVKHALKTLLKAGIKPWACILLDPRSHVSNFVTYPDRDINWFIASMVTPEVALHLTNYGCNVFGYHAIVGADETKYLPKGAMLIQGGSATATRGISLLRALGFRKMHLYGYDCCFFAKPDLQEKKDNGKMRFEEVTLSAEGWDGKISHRTFWTEGQFLAQVQEMNKVYLPDKELELHTYGDGIIPWMHSQNLRFEEWKKHALSENKKALISRSNINEWIRINGISEPRDTVR